jgi:hypothetical protein
MNDARSVNVRADLWSTFARRGAGSLLEIDAWMQSEIKGISPLVERLMRLVEGSHCVTGEETAAEPALREALNNAVIHGNRLDARTERNNAALHTAEIVAASHRAAETE